ncbi:MAG: hypothetical protein M1838_004898 [Thelocarpon superellum]|nr:MAG: hypothetical protein M1838_004898 [Thelocarpon superellum]
MNHQLPAVPHVLPAIPLRPGRRPNEYYNRPPHPPQMSHPPSDPVHYQPPPPPPHGHGHGHGHPHAYPPHQYRPWGPPYPQYPLPPVHPYANAPLIVSSSYPQTQASAPPPPPPPAALPRQLPHQAPPPVPVPVPVQTAPPAPLPSSSAAQSQPLVSPTASTTSLNVSTPPQSNSTPSLRVPTPPLVPPVTFEPPLPWYSVPDEAFPPRAPRRRRRRAAPEPSAVSVELPSSRERSAPPQCDAPSVAVQSTATATTGSRSETPLTSHPPSEADSTHPTTPSSALPPTTTASQAAPTTAKATSRPILPAIPLTAVVPHVVAGSAPREGRSPEFHTLPSEHVLSPTADAANTSRPPPDGVPVPASPSSDRTPKPSSPPVKAAPKSWADLVRSNVPQTPTADAGGSINGTASAGGLKDAKATTLTEVLTSFAVDRGADETRKMAFLEPRGLVLQVLVFCQPFYAFLDTIAKQAPHSFKSDTPLLDAMIMFMREFPVIDSAVSAEQLRLRLKDAELEQYGEPFTPEFVYEVIRRMPRFASMRRGHQQDAEEFLGFLLEGLHDECVQVLKGHGPSGPGSGSGSGSMSGTSSPAAVAEASGLNGDGGWFEVGPKQKAAVTRSSGTIATESPVTKIFGGKLRSELRVPGLKNSVTLEPYQPLQLDIQSPQISNITDALKGLTRSETLHGDFHSPRGPGATATKQVFIDTLPPVLILHLKRFQYDNAGGTQKIWKKVGYPLQLDIPKEAFPPSRRAGLSLHGGLPTYRLIGVVYHHGKNASGGHYTVDVRRQDGREWIRLDDTAIQRVRSEDVAEAGSGGRELSYSHNGPHGAPADEGEGGHDRDAGADGPSSRDEPGWSQVNGVSTSAAEPWKKTWAGAVNGNTTATPTPSRATESGRSGEKASVKDNKVAYLLFYQRI